MLKEMMIKSGIMVAGLVITSVILEKLEKKSLKVKTEVESENKEDVTND